MLAFAPWRSAQHYHDYLNEMGKIHPEWFHTFERQERGHPMMSVKMAELWSNPDALGFLIAVQQHARGKMPDGKGVSNETRQL